MAPIEEAGQPIVIGGVVIEHGDQKVNFGNFKTAVTNLRRLYMTNLSCNIQ